MVHLPTSCIGADAAEPIICRQSHYVLARVRKCEDEVEEDIDTVYRLLATNSDRGAKGSGLSKRSVVSCLAVKHGLSA